MRIELRFNEPVTPLGAKLLDGAGRALPLSDLQASGERVEVGLPSRLSEGRYTFTYRVVSLDSHPIGGSIAFGVGVAASPTSAPRSDELWAWRVGLRAMRDLALLVAAGGALFLIAVGRFPRDRAVLSSFGLLAAGAATLSIGFQGSALLGAGVSPFSSDAWQTGLHSSFGRSSLLAAAAGLVLAGVRGKVFLVLGALAAIISLPLTGHAAARGGIAPAVLAVHGLGAAFWAGSLVALLLSVRYAASAEAAAALRRFSYLGVPAVMLLFIAGSVLAWLQLPSLTDLGGSPYGRLIVGKLALFAGLLVLAGLNRWRYLPRLASGEPAVRPRLRRSIIAEIALMACVASLTALLVQTPPPRTPGFTATSSMDGRAAELSIAPARAGHNTVTVRFRDAQGQVFDPAEVELGSSNPQAGVEPAVRAMQRVRPGEFRREGSELAFPGAWTVEIHARIGDFERRTFRFEVPVR